MSADTDVQALEERVKAFVLEHELIASGGAVDVALSGGVDSVALVAILTRLGASLRWRVRAHHVRHRMRPGDEADMQVCVDVCDGLGVELVVTELAVGAVAAHDGRGPEEKARVMRYRALEAAARAGGVATLATAHHGDDNIETLLLRLVRGSGLEGIAGIAPKRRLEGSAGAPIALVRPLLLLGRAETERYAEQRGLLSCVDPSNVDRRFLRNRLRAEALAGLERAAGERGLSAARRTMLLLRQDADALGGVAEQLVGLGEMTEEPAWYLPIEALRSMGRPVAAQVVRHAAHRLANGHTLTALAVHKALTQLGVERSTDAATVRDNPAACGAWDDGVVCIGRDGRFAAVRVRDAGTPSPCRPRQLLPQSTTHCGRVTLTRVDTSAAVAAVLSGKEHQGHVGSWPRVAIVEPVRVVQAIEVDRFPLGAGASAVSGSKGSGSKALRKMLAEMGIPRPWRAGHPVVVDALGPLWVVGGPTSHRAPAAADDDRVTLIAQRVPWYLRRLGYVAEKRDEG